MLNHLSIDGNLVYFEIFATLNKAAMKIVVKRAGISYGKITRYGLLNRKIYSS